MTPIQLHNQSVSDWAVPYLKGQLPGTAPSAARPSTPNSGSGWGWGLGLGALALGGAAIAFAPQIKGYWGAYQQYNKLKPLIGSLQNGTADFNDPQVQQGMKELHELSGNEYFQGMASTFDPSGYKKLQQFSNIYSKGSQFIPYLGWANNIMKGTKQFDINNKNDVSTAKNFGDIINQDPDAFQSALGEDVANSPKVKLLRSGAATGSLEAASRLNDYNKSKEQAKLEAQGDMSTQGNGVPTIISGSTRQILTDADHRERMKGYGYANMLSDVDKVLGDKNLRGPAATPQQKDALKAVNKGRKELIAGLPWQMLPKLNGNDYGDYGTTDKNGTIHWK